MTACRCGAERPCMSPMIRCDHPMRNPGARVLALTRIHADAETQARLDRIDAVARAIYEAERDASWDDAAEWVRDDYRPLAVAAMDAMRRTR